MEVSADDPLLQPGQSETVRSADRRTHVFRDVVFMKNGPDNVTVTFPKQPMWSCSKVVAIVLYIFFGVGFICFGTFTGVDKSFDDVPLYLFIPTYIVVGCLLLSCLLASSFTSSELRLTRHDLSYQIKGACFDQNVELSRDNIREVRYVDRTATLGPNGRRTVRKVAVMAVVMYDGAVHELLSNIKEDETKWVTSLILQEMPEIAL